MVRRGSFIAGLLLGSALSAFALGAAMVYFFTGKVLSVRSASGKVSLELNDLALQEVMVREEKV
jgi:hypothetical protein